MVIPAGASEGRVQFGAVTLTRTSIEAQPAEFQNIEITEEMIKKSLSWIHNRLYFITRSYEWNIGQIDKDAFSQSSSWLTCFKCAGGTHHPTILRFCIRLDIFCHCFFLWTTLVTLNSGLASLRCIGLASFTTCTMTLQKEIDQCLRFLFVRPMFNPWSEACFSRMRRSLMCGIGEGTRPDFFPKPYKRRLTIILLLWSVGLMSIA